MRPFQAPLPPHPRQLDLLAETTRPSLTLREQREVVALLASLLIEASGVATSEADDDGL